MSKILSYRDYMELSSFMEQYPEFHMAMAYIAKLACVLDKDRDAESFIYKANEFKNFMLRQILDYDYDD